MEKKIKAVALKYEPEKIDGAPYIVSKGEENVHIKKINENIDIEKSCLEYGLFYTSKKN